MLACIVVDANVVCFDNQLFRVAGAKSTNPVLLLVLFLTFSIIIDFCLLFRRLDVILLDFEQVLRYITVDISM